VKDLELPTATPRNLLNIAQDFADVDGLAVVGTVIFAEALHRTASPHSTDLRSVKIPSPPANEAETSPANGNGPNPNRNP
jgi:hypothetical protein